MTSNNQNVLDILLLNKKKYIVLFSGLEFSPVEKIVTDLSKDFNAIVLNYLHLNLDDSLDPLNTRVNDLLNKNEKMTQPIFIIAKSFPSDKLKIYPDIHINISLHKFAILNLDPAKRADLPDLYAKSIQTNRVNRYINLKKEYELNDIINEVFNLIIDDIEKKVYGDKYESLSHKFFSQSKQNNTSQQNYTSEQNNKSKLVFDPKSITPAEKQQIALEKAEIDIQDSIDDSEDSISAEKDLDKEEDDVLNDEIRILGKSSLKNSKSRSFGKSSSKKHYNKI